MSDRAITVRELAERYGVGARTALTWIARGELRAVDVSRERGGRPRWRITTEALEAFELARTPSPLPPRARRRRAPDDVVEFYK